MKAWIVVDLGFGDAGKGTTTDFLVRDRRADLVVRFNGGAQAGHNVVTADGRHHTFAQFGSGSFVPGVGTHLSDAFLLHPGGMLVEAEVLSSVGVSDVFERTTVDRGARVISPYQQVAGQLRERLRGADAHGTTGIGIGETVADAGFDDAIAAGDLVAPDVLRRKLVCQRERKRAELESARDLDGYAVFEDRDLVGRTLDRWAELARRLHLLDTDASRARLARSPAVVFEGAQGVLLDETWGFHPHTTWSDTTPAAAARWAEGRDVVRLGVTRTWTTRHGAGPFPTERPDWRLPELHNADVGWPGRFRVGPLDGVLLRYAAEVAGPLDGIVVTGVDRFPGEVCRAYLDSDGREVVRLEPGAARDVAHREALGRGLREARPLTEPLPDVPSLLAFVADRTGTPTVLVSHGPTATDKRWLRVQ